MKRSQKRIPIAGIILLSLLLISCFRVQVKKSVNNPHTYFKRANRQIEKIHRYFPNRQGKPSRIFVLLYNQNSREMIQISAPIWLANACMEVGMSAVEESDDFDFEERYDFDWSGIKDVSRIGPGLLLEVDDEKNKILIWLR
jgi:hypothetical protein